MLHSVITSLQIYDLTETFIKSATDKTISDNSSQTIVEPGTYGFYMDRNGIQKFARSNLAFTMDKLCSFDYQISKHLDRNPVYNDIQSYYEAFDKESKGIVGLFPYLHRNHTNTGLRTMGILLRFC